MTYRRILSLILTLVVALTFTPIADFARAEDAAPEPELSEAIEAAPVDEAVPVVDELVIGEAEPAAEDEIIPEDDVSEPEEDVVEEEVQLEDIAAPEEQADAELEDDASIDEDDIYIDEDDVTSLEKSVQALFGAGVATNTAIKHNITLTQSGTTATIKGSIYAPYYVYGLFEVDGDVNLISQVTGSSINQSINMNNYATGYHTFVVGVSNSPIISDSTKVVGYIKLTYAYSNKITARPTYGGVFDVYSTALNFYPYDMYLHNQSDDLYMEYSADNGRTWKRTGYMRANMIKLYIQQAYTISGLAPNTTYLTRLRYGTFVTYSKDCFGDGKSYFFGGPVLNTLTFRTGAATAPAIKSVTLKATKVKRHKVKHPGYYSYVGGTLFWHKAYTEKYYTCNVRVTVKLKKKPGTNGMWIYFGGQKKYVSGNKKKYVATFTPYPNYFPKKPRGRYSYTVTVRSGQSSSYGGYSPTWSKSRKLK